MSTLTFFSAETCTLSDGSRVQIRALGLDDQERLKAFFYRLSPRSVFQRILEYRTMITDHEVELLCDMDGEARVALAATQRVEGEEVLLAVARYSLIDPSRPDTAEAAIVVEDRFQRRGLGRLLIARLTECARAHHVAQFMATVHPNNAQILRFIEHSGFPVKRRMVEGIWELLIELTPSSAR